MSGVEIIAATAAVVGAVGSISQGMAQSKAANYNAKIAENNAIGARMAAGAEADRHRRQAMLLTGAQKAAYGKAGVQTTGSALDVIGDSAGEAELDALTILYGGEARARSAEADATAQRFAGSAARTSSYFGAGSSLLTGAGRVASRRATVPRNSQEDY